MQFLLIFLVFVCRVHSVFVDVAPTNVDPVWEGGVHNGFHNALNHCKSVSPILDNGSECPMFQLIAGIAVYDFNYDGYDDIYIANAVGEINRLYIVTGLDINGYPLFEDRSSQVGIDLINHDSGMPCIGDFDNDGDADIFVTHYTMGGAAYLENDGTGNFTDKSVEYGLVSLTSGMSNLLCTLGDFNLDGYLDVYLGNSFNNSNKLPIYNAWDPTKESNMLIIGRGNGTFYDASSHYPQRGLVTWGVTAVDWNMDGYVDFADVHDQAAVNPLPPPFGTGEQQGLIRLFKNNGSGYFSDESIAVGVQSANPFQQISLTGAWMSIDFGDYDCNGELDFDATNLGGIHFHSLLLESGVIVDCQLRATKWFSQIDGKFYQNLDAEGSPFGWGMLFIDIDNDADLDQAMVGGMYWGMIPSIGLQTSFELFENQGSCSGIFSRNTAWRGDINRLRNDDHPLAEGDFNGDGKMDLVTASELSWDSSLPLTLLEPLCTDNAFWNDTWIIKGEWETPENCTGINCYPKTYNQSSTAPKNGTLGIFINNVASNSNGWIKVKPIGGSNLVANCKNNRDGIGAVMSFTSKNSSSIVAPTMIRPMVAGHSFVSQSASYVHSGMGNYKKMDVDILWPGGVRNYLSDLNPHSTYLAPEIPCCIKATSDLNNLVTCTNTALDEYIQHAVLQQNEKGKYISSMIDGWRKYH